MARRGENIYKRKDGRWEGRYKHDGMPRYKSVYGKSYSEVRAKLSEAKQKSIRHQPMNDYWNSKFSILISAWLNNVQTRVKESTYAQYYVKVQKHIIPRLGNMKTSSISTCDIEQFNKAALASGLSSKTVSDTLVVVKSIFKYGKIPFDFSEIKIRTEEKEMRVLNQHEQAKLTSHLTSNPDNAKLGVLLSLYTGLRIGEVCALKWSDISFESGIAVKHTIQRVKRISEGDVAKTKIIIDSPKSKCAVRNIPIPDFLKPMLDGMRKNDDDYVVTGHEHPIEPRALQYKFKGYLNRCGIDHANYHCTRHTFATRCVEAGFEIKSLSEILGHSNVRITLDRYVHSSFALKTVNMNKLSLAVA